MKTIISASRRTDLPKFYYSWLQSALVAGEVELHNPVYIEKTYKVDLRPENVHSIVLWSKDFRNVLHDPMYLDNYYLYFQYTINLYPKLLEPGVPEYRDTLKTLEGLLKRYRPEQFNIRFDPVFFCSEAESINYVTSCQERVNAFETLCKDLVSVGMTGCRLTTSYIQMYAHVVRRLKLRDVNTLQLDEHQKSKLFTNLAEIAAKYGLPLYSCSCPELEQIPGIKKGHCVDGLLLKQLFGGKTTLAKDYGQRQACGCVKSSDIGGYHQKCGGDCVYCYAKISGPNK